MGWWKRLTRGLLGGTPTYDGTGFGRRTLAWQVGNPGAIAALLTTQNELRAKSRDLVRRNTGRMPPWNPMSPMPSAPASSRSRW